jgi:hypothetical protein
MICMSVKFQITLPDDLAFQLKRAAAERKTPLAQFIRETMQDKLHEPPRERNAFLDRITGIVDSDETDLASRVDEILYGPGNEHT